MLYRLLVAASVLGLAGCDLNVFRRTPIVESGSGTHAQEMTVEQDALETTPSGLQYQDLVVGTGTPAVPGRAAVVHYTGWLLDGSKFDSSRDRNEPFEFAVGAGQVIAGWDEGVAGMKIGGRRKLVIPSTLGYGARDVGPIPANSTLVFDVELLDVR